MPLRMVQARGLGKFFSPRSTGTKVGGHDALAREMFARLTFSMLFDFDDHCRVELRFGLSELLQETTQMTGNRGNADFFLATTQS